MGKPGAQPNPEPSPVAIVRHGLTRHQRILIANRDERYMRVVHAQNWSAVVINEICRLCDEFAQKHGTYQERHA